MANILKIVILEEMPINTLAAAELLHLLITPPNAELVIIKSVIDEIVVRNPKLQQFIVMHKARINIQSTSICRDDDAKRQRCEPVGQGRSELAVADFILNCWDEAIGDSPALVIYEDKKLEPVSGQFGYSERTHFITTAVYLRMLEQEGITALDGKTIVKPGLGPPGGGPLWD